MTLAVVQFDDRARHVQTCAQPAFEAERRARPLGEQVEHHGQHLRLHAGAVVGHGDHRPALVGARGQADDTAVGGVLGGVDQQVGEGLRQPGRIGMDREFLGHIQKQLLVPFQDTQLHRLQGAPQQGHQRQRGGRERHGAAVDAGRIDQFVEQAGQMQHLAVDHRVHIEQARRGIGQLGQHGVGQADGGERIAQFVRQRRQEGVVARRGKHGLLAQGGDLGVALRQRQAQGGHLGGQGVFGGCGRSCGAVLVRHGVLCSSRR